MSPSIAVLRLASHAPQSCSPLHPFAVGKTNVMMMMIAFITFNSSLAPLIENVMMMMIALITFNSSLAHLIEGLCDYYMPAKD